MEIKRVVKFGRYWRFQHLEGKRFILIGLFNIAMAILGFLFMPMPLKTLAILSVLAAIVAIVALVRANIVTMPRLGKGRLE